MFSGFVSSVPLQISREEKYKAKLVVDTVVQRLGDVGAALVFELLGELPNVWVSLVLWVGELVG